MTTASAGRITCKPDNSWRVEATSLDKWNERITQTATSGTSNKPDRMPSLADMRMRCVSHTPTRNRPGFAGLNFIR